MTAAEIKEHPTFALMKRTDVQSIYHMQMPRWLSRHADMSLDAKVACAFLLNRFQFSPGTAGSTIMARSLSSFRARNWSGS